MGKNTSLIALYVTNVTNDIRYFSDGLLLALGISLLLTLGIFSRWDSFFVILQ